MIEDFNSGGLITKRDNAKCKDGYTKRQSRRIGLNEQLFV